MSRIFLLLNALVVASLISASESTDVFYCGGKKSGEFDMGVDKSWICDGGNDCDDGSDETSKQAHNLVGGCFNCSASGKFMKKKDTCRCDVLEGEMLKRCLNGPDNLYEWFHCLDNKERAVKDDSLCNGIKDCEDGSDEWSDAAHRVSGGCFVCLDNKERAVKGESLCNGFRDCEDGSDEWSDAAHRVAGGCHDCSGRCERNKDCKGPFVKCLPCAFQERVNGFCPSKEDIRCSTSHAMLQRCYNRKDMDRPNMERHHNDVDDDRSDSTSCEIDWIAYQGSCYRLFPTKVTWKSAVSLCSSYGAKNTLPRNLDESDFLKNQIEQQPDVDWIWLNVNDKETEGTWQAGDGADITWFNWGAGEPAGDGKRDDDCAGMDVTGKWKNGPCAYRINAMCVKRATDSCPAGGFRCPGGPCRPNQNKCDGKRDCHDGSDEKNCDSCPAGGFRCPGGPCRPNQNKCDGKRDCHDGSDEKNCGGSKKRELLTLLRKLSKKLKERK